MAKSERHPCRGCAGGEYDPRLAIEQLARQQAEIALTVQGALRKLVEPSRAVDTKALRETAMILERIVGGRETKENDFPECCLVGERYPNGTEEWNCTGVLIHPRVVLTAAHCHNPPEIRSNIVALNAVNKDRLGRAEIIDARMTVVHPLYLSTGYHDIAVIILRAASNIKPASIATPEQTLAAAADDRDIELVGFGKNDVLATRGFGIQRRVAVKITHLRRSAEENLDPAEQRYGFESDHEFIAGGVGFDSCNGDSGGPALLLQEGKKIVVGLTSSGVRNAPQPCGDGGIYTRLDTHLDFITSVMRDNGLA